MYSDRSALQLYKKVTYATLAYREKKNVLDSNYLYDSTLLFFFI